MVSIGARILHKRRSPQTNNFNKMKNQHTVFLQAALIFVVLLGAVSCVSKKTDDTKEEAEEHNEAKFNDSNNEKDAQFLVNAAEINREEISLGKLAQENGKTAHVKELGKMMEVEHTKSLKDLTALAKTKNVTLPESQTNKGEDDYKKLNNESGSTFDLAYADMMVSGHKDAIAMFEKAAKECTDSDIRSWAEATLPLLRMHLDHSLTCQKECKKK